MSKISTELYPVVAQSLLYGGGNVGLYCPVERASFRVKQNGVMLEWPVFKALARLAEFSPAARRRILEDCVAQVEVDVALYHSAQQSQLQCDPYLRNGTAEGGQDDA